MVAGALVVQGPVAQHTMGRWPDRHDLPRRGDTHQKAVPGEEELLGRKTAKDAPTAHPTISTDTPLCSVTYMPVW